MYQIGNLPTHHWSEYPQGSSSSWLCVSPSPSTPIMVTPWQKRDVPGNRPKIPVSIQRRTSTLDINQFTMDATLKAVMIKSHRMESSKRQIGPPSHYHALSATVTHKE